MEIAILLSTYNGCNYIGQQIDSIRRQTCTEWKLYIRDDGSTDGTRDLILEAARLDRRICPMLDGSNLGAKESFMWMLRNVSADYYMFCDHDDVWLPHKVELTLRRMLEAEATHHGPVIACTNIELVDANLGVIAPSYWEYKNYDSSMFNDKYYHLCYNNIPGCTMMLNQEAKKASFPYSEHIVMHDAWVAAATLWKGGFITAEPTPQMLYRQHAHNAIGAPKNRTLVRQIMMARGLMRKTREQYESLRGITGMSYVAYFFCKLKYLLREHASNLLKKKAQ